MKTNEIKKGMRVKLRNGWYGTMMDNQRGTTRMVEVEGYYTEIVPRSSISKFGYILSNNIGIIDNNYRGNFPTYSIRETGDYSIVASLPLTVTFPSTYYSNTWELAAYKVNSSGVETLISKNEYEFTGFIIKNTYLN
jgi:hypothetical protein